MKEDVQVTRQRILDAAQADIDAGVNVDWALFVIALIQSAMALEEN